jgi:A/G-specific adenine glycosylase
MDLGATLCARSKPACGLCPLVARCEAHRQHRTADFPGKKPTRVLPVKATFMLMYVDEQRQRVLLEKRPPTGIWGGLWSFPETADLAGFAQAFNGNLMLDPRAMQPWATLRHTFSHFHLDITPVLIPLQADAVSVMEADRFHWYALLQPSAVGLAAPVKQLLERLVQQLPLSIKQ